MFFGSVKNIKLSGPESVLPLGGGRLDPWTDQTSDLKNGSTCLSAWHSLYGSSFPRDKFHTPLECDRHVPPGRALKETQDTLDGVGLLAGVGTPWGPSGGVGGCDCGQ